LFEAQHNAEHYEEEIARIRQELGKSPGGPPRGQTGAGAVLPQTAKQGLGALVISAASFLAGAILGSKVKSRRSGAPKDK
jgi:hypothetical protein